MKLSISYPLGLAILEIFAEAQQLGRARRLDLAPGYSVVRTPKTSRVVWCSTCGRRNHNRRTCPGDE